MTPSQPPSESRTPPSQGQHVATISHDGRFWDVYLEFEDDPRRPDSFRGLLCFSPADAEDAESAVRTRTIIIENSWEEATAKARSFDERQFTGMLRSCLPD